MRRQEEALRNAALSARLRTESQEERRLHKLYASTLKASRDIETLADQTKLPPFSPFCTVSNYVRSFGTASRDVRVTFLIITFSTVE